MTVCCTSGVTDPTEYSVPVYIAIIITVGILEART